MHPIEHLRHVARARGVDATTLVVETASAMSAMRLDPSALVVACRRVVERQAECGPLWWFASRLLTAMDPDQAIWELVNEISTDQTARHVAAAIPDDATVVVIGDGAHLIDAVARRGDLTVLVVDSQYSGTSVMKRLERAEVAAEPVRPDALAGAVAAGDVVLFETPATSATVALCPSGAMAAAAVARYRETPVWMVAGCGTRLPHEYLERIVECVVDADRRWEADHDVVEVDLITSVIGPDGVVGAASITQQCPFTPELLRISAI